MHSLRGAVSTQEKQVLETAEAGSVGDAIRAMTDEQLAYAIGEQATTCICDLVCPEGCQAKTKNECRQIALNWLRGGWKDDNSRHVIRRIQA